MYTCGCTACEGSIPCWRSGHPLKGLLSLYKLINSGMPESANAMASAVTECLTLLHAYTELSLACCKMIYKYIHPISCHYSLLSLDGLVSFGMLKSARAVASAVTDCLTLLHACITINSSHCKRIPHLYWRIACSPQVCHHHIS